MYKAALWFLLLIGYLAAAGPARAQTPDSVARHSAADTVVRPQKRLQLKVQPAPADRAVLRKYRYQTGHADSLSALRELTSLTLQLREDGYLTASADTLFMRADTLVAAIYLGPRLRWARLESSNVSEAIITRAGFREKFYRDKPFRPSELARLQERILDQAEESGYPFASVQLDSITFQQDQITARLVLDKGPYITFDSVQILGKTRTKSKFLSRYLQIGYGQPYSQQRVKASARLLRQLPYVQSTQPGQLRFARNRVRLYYFLEDKKANQLDGIVGFLPDPVTNKLLITGELNAMLRNITGSGKEISLQWRKVQAASQLLDVGYVHPNLLGSPLEFEFRFNLYKQDTTFLNLNPRFQFNYYTTRYGRLGFFHEVKSSRYLGTRDTTKAAVARYASSIYRSYGLSYTWQNLDDLYFPRRGWLATATGAIGNKRIETLTVRQEQGVPARTAQTTFSGRLERYQRVSKNSTLLLRLRGATIRNPYLFQNELLRLGGLNSLRGFNEFEFYTSSYSVATAEYRLFTGSDSYLLVFFDQGWYEQRVYDEKKRQNQTQKPDYPFGVGAGISFSTGAGIFNFIYSIGQARNQPFNLNTSKIHFGFTSRF